MFLPSKWPSISTTWSIDSLLHACIIVSRSHHLFDDCHHPFKLSRLIASGCHLQDIDRSCTWSFLPPISRRLHHLIMSWKSVTRCGSWDGTTGVLDQKDLRLKRATQSIRASRPNRGRVPTKPCTTTNPAARPSESCITNIRAARSSEPCTRLTHALDRAITRPCRAPVRAVRLESPSRAYARALGRIHP